MAQPTRVEQTAVPPGMFLYKLNVEDWTDVYLEILQTELRVFDSGGNSISTLTLKPFVGERNGHITLGGSKGSIVAALREMFFFGPAHGHVEKWDFINDTLLPGYWKCSQTKDF